MAMVGWVGAGMEMVDGMQTAESQVGCPHVMQRHDSNG